MKPRSFINRCELIKPLTSSSNSWDELHIELDRAPRNLKASVRLSRASSILSSVKRDRHGDDEIFSEGLAARHTHGRAVEDTDWF
jgi:hypothetical protein